VIFLYMGPPPAPLLPQFHFLVADGWRRIAFQGFTNCNWLQAVENGMDPIHPAFLHKDQWPWRAPTPDRMEFFETDWAVVSKAHRPAARGYDETLSVHASVFPAMSMAVHEAMEPSGLPPASARFSTPIDDTHTAQIRVMYSPVERRRREPPPEAGYSNPEHDRLFDLWTKALDRGERSEVSIQLYKSMNDNLPGLPLYFNFWVIGHRAELEGPRARLPETQPLYRNLHEWHWAR